MSRPYPINPTTAGLLARPTPTFSSPVCSTSVHTLMVSARNSVLRSSAVSASRTVWSQCTKITDDRQTARRAVGLIPTSWLAKQLHICFRYVSGLFLFPFCFLSVLFLSHCNCTRALTAKLAYRPPCILYKLYSAQKHSIRGLQHDAFATAAAVEKSTFRLCVWFAIAILL